MSCKIGEENMDDLDLAANANAVATTIEKKNCPMEIRTSKKIMVKTTMGNIVKLEQVKEKNA